MALTSSISRRYATAFIEAAEAAGDLDAGTAALEDFARLFDDSSDLANVLVNPVFTGDERKKSLIAVMDALKVSGVLRRFLELIGERGRMDEIPAITRAVRRLADDRASRVRATVESATELASDAVDNLRRALEKRTGKTVELEVAVDPSLLGGIRTTIGSMVFDGTIRSQLDQLRDTLNRAE